MLGHRPEARPVTLFDPGHRLLPAQPGKCRVGDATDKGVMRGEIGVGVPEVLMEDVDWHEIVRNQT